MLKDMFRFAEHQGKDIHGLGYKLTLTSKKVDAVLEKAAGIADSGYKVAHIHWYVPHYTPSIEETRIYLV